MPSIRIQAANAVSIIAVGRNKAGGEWTYVDWQPFRESSALLLVPNADPGVYNAVISYPDGTERFLGPATVKAGNDWSEIIRAADNQGWRKRLEAGDPDAIPAYKTKKLGPGWQDAGPSSSSSDGPGLLGWLFAAWLASRALS